MKIDSKRLARALDVVREKERLTWNSMAIVLGVSRKALYDWRNGRSEPKSRSLKKLRVLGISIDMLVPYSSVSIKHMMAPLDYTRIAGEYRQLRRKGKGKEAAVYASHAAAKLATSLRDRLDGLSVEDVEIVNSTYHIAGCHPRSAVHVVCTGKDSRFVLDLEPSPLDFELDVALSKRISGAEGLKPVCRGRVCEAEILRLSNYLAVECGASMAVRP